MSSDAFRISLPIKLPDLDKETMDAIDAYLVAVYQRGYADAKAKLCEGCSYKSYYAQVAAQGDCNDCGKARTCEHVPRPGGIVRINCPLWRAKG